jgi:hypothetical protein
MPLVTVQDLRDRVSSLVIDGGTSPNEDQVEQMIVNVEGELTAIVGAVGATWPTVPTSVVGAYVAEVEVKGVLCALYSAKYALTPQENVPFFAGEMCRAYQAAKKELINLGPALSDAGNEFVQTPGLPLLGNQDDAPRRHGSFGQWTTEVARRDERAGWGRVIR